MTRRLATIFFSKSREGPATVLDICPYLWYMIFILGGPYD